jgi:hypothetical protein
MFGTEDLKNKQIANIRQQSDYIEVSLYCDDGNGLKWHIGQIHNKKETLKKVQQRLLRNGFKKVVILKHNE